MISEQAAVYAAENQLSDLLDLADETENRQYAFYESVLTLPIERRFASLESIETYCNKVLALDSIRERYPVQAAHPVTVRHRRGDRAAHYESPGTIAINENGSRWALREIVVLHELAHHLALHDEHGKQFQMAHAHLLTACIGPEAGIILYSFYDKNVRST